MYKSHPHYQKQKKTKTRWLIILFIACLLWVVFYTPKQEFKLTIQAGQSLAEIAQTLDQEDIINSQKLFLFIASQKNLDKSIHTGTFVLNNKMSNLEILRAINQASQIQNLITIPEGFTITQIANKFQDPKLLNCLKSDCEQTQISQIAPETQIKGLEGFLYPQTYSYQNTDLLLQQMTSQFIKNLPSNYQQQISQLPIQSLYEVIIVASMLEKEVLSLKDKQIAAGIIYKRLSNNWTLGIDATLLYQKNNREITIQDLKADHPYNTRKNLGLPPTPICNPGADSIQAALTPLTTDFWFYLTTPTDNKVIYGRNNQEHEANKQKYLR